MPWIIWDKPAGLFQVNNSSNQKFLLNLSKIRLFVTLQHLVGLYIFKQITIPGILMKYTTEMSSCIFLIKIFSDKLYF